MDQQVKSETYRVDEDGNFVVPNDTNSVIEFFSSYIINVCIGMTIRGTSDKEYVKNTARKLINEVFQAVLTGYTRSFDFIYGMHDRNRIILPDQKPVITDLP